MANQWSYQFQILVIGKWELLLLFGKMPVTKTLPNTWYNTPNLHMCTIKDLFIFYDKKIKIKKVVGVNEDKTSLIKEII